MIEDKELAKEFYNSIDPKKFTQSKVELNIEYLRNKSAACRILHQNQHKFKLHFVHQYQKHNHIE